MRIFIPTTMRDEILKRIHTPHMSVEKSMLRARSCVYCYTIVDDIDMMTKERVPANTV